MKKIKTFSEEDFCRRLHSLYIPKAIAEGMVSEIFTWLRESGPEWTVKRLKALKTDFIQILAGNGKVSTWIKYKQGVPAGHFGRLFHYGLKSRNDPSHVTRVLNALNSHTAFLSLVETEQQLDKFYGSVSAVPAKASAVSYAFGLIEPLLERYAVNPKTRIRTLKDYVPKDKRAPSADGRSVPEKEWLQTISCIWDTSLGSELYYNFSQLREVLNPLASVVGKHLKSAPSWHKAGREIQAQGFAGKIGHIQEPGLKLRAVANPFRVYQLALSRLGDQLYKLVKSLPWDCTHNQEEGTLWAEKKLSSAHTMFAVDLSDATNVFPLDLQIRVLRGIKHVNPEDIALLEALATAPWLSPTHGLVTWTKGQPLGLYPSFGLFTLTHGLLLRGIEHSLCKHDTFRVLGDDVVISDPKVHTLYRNVLADLDMPVSEDKTLISNKITEFAGRVIFPGSTSVVGKWRSVSDRNFMDLLYNIGPRFLSSLKTRQARVASLVMTLPVPVGLGMNPKGISAEDRWDLEDSLSYLFEPKYDLPEYGKQTWPWSEMKSPIIGPELFDGTLSEGTWTQPRHHSAPAESAFVELHSRLKQSIGVVALPSRQLAELSLSYADLLDLAKRLAVVQDLIQSWTTGDPRGSSALTLWEKRLKAAKSTRS